jgi:hypothetical protein
VKRAWRLEQWILAVTIPALVLVALVLGVAVYRGLYRRVLEGFDRKLLAATSTVAAFIDGDEHRSLLRPIPMRALAWDAAQSRLLGADSSGRLYVVDTITGEADLLPDGVGRTARGLFPAERAGRVPAPATDGRQRWAPGPEGLRHWPGLEPNEPADTTEYALGFRSRNEALYRKYVEPMRAIQRKQNVTYIYTQVLREPYAIAYVLDASEGEDQSLIGGRDVVPPEDYESTQEVLARHEVQFERWGLLKVSTGPILDGRGRSSAAAGVDVNISIIQRKTRQALIEVLALSAAVWLAAAALAILMARRLARTLGLLKGAALSVAAGQYGQEVTLRSPRELVRVAGAFSRLSRNLKETFFRMGRETAALEFGRSREDLARRLHEPPAHPAVQESYAPGQPGSLSGHAWRDQRIVVWLSEERCPPLAAGRALARRRDLAVRLLQRYGGPGESAALLESLARHAAGTLIWFDAATGEVLRHALHGRDSWQLGPGEQAVFESGAGAAPLYRIVLRRWQAGTIAAAGA